MVEHVLASLGENKDMDFVEKVTNMDVVLLVTSEIPLKLPKPSFLFQMVVLRVNSNNSTKYVQSMLSVMDQTHHSYVYYLYHLLLDKSCRVLDFLI